MKTEKREGALERKVITGMIVDRQVLAAIAPHWTKDSFQNKYFNLIGEWAVRYFSKYGKAPGPNIETIFQEWADAKNRDATRINNIEDLLSELSGKYKRLQRESNTNYVLDVARDVFMRATVERAIRDAGAELAMNRVAKAKEVLQGVSVKDIGTRGDIDLLASAERYDKAINSQREPLIQYPKALQRFFGQALERDAFIAFMGPEKSGKTFWLIDLAWRAMWQRRKVIFYAVGDMSEEQMLRRFAARAMARPLRPKKFRIPVDLVNDRDEPFAQVRHEEREVTDTVTAKQIAERMERIRKTRIRSNDTYFRMSVHPNTSINVAGIESHLMQLEQQEDWRPDVIVIDYADILAPPINAGTETREGVNSTWKQLRALSQKLHCLLVTATQADANSYNAPTVRRSNFSEDKRKLAHVTGLCGLSAIDAEIEMGLQRLNWIVLRDSAFTESHCVHVAHCRDICNPAVLSTF